MKKILPYPIYRILIMSFVEKKNCSFHQKIKKVNLGLSLKYEHILTIINQTENSASLNIQSRLSLHFVSTKVNSENNVNQFPTERPIVSRFRRNAPCTRRKYSLQTDGNIFPANRNGIFSNVERNESHVLSRLDYYVRGAGTPRARIRIQRII